MAVRVKKDRRLKRLKRKSREAQARVNLKVQKRIRELQKDGNFMEKLDKELAEADDLKAYVNSAYARSKAE